jgi:hypothetical protein
MNPSSDSALALTVVLVAFALLETALGLLAALLFMRRVGLPRAKAVGAVTLILPLTGKAPFLDRLLRALDSQTLPPRRLIVSVEDPHDPAYRRALQLADGCSFPIEIVVAGEATRCAQKCTNLTAAMARIDDRDEAIVLLDADILPPSWWLSALATPVLDGSADLVNGYRWPTIAAQTLGAHLGASIERAIALLPRPRWLKIAWGGSLAISVEAMQKLETAKILSDTLSDDCTIGQHAGALGLRMLTRRALLVPTPLENGLLPLWRYARRQYQICRIYVPALWWLAFGMLSSRLVAWALLFAHLEHPPARFALGALVAMTFSGCVVQSMVGRRLGFPDAPGSRLAQCGLSVFKPVVDLFHWTAVAAASATRTVRWSHVTYGVRGPTRILVRSRVPWR